MLISHETPIAALKESFTYNDYDYCLVHLLDNYFEYYNFFKSSIENGREVLLDNSIFELKKAFDAGKFANWVEKLRPTYYIVPDELEDGAQTIDNFKHWCKNYNDLPGMKIGAVQGKTYQEIAECYKFMADNADYIAISFDFSYYDITGEGKTKLERLSSGRRILIDRLIDYGVWCHSKPHHLLGCSLPTEFSHYKHTKNIRSLDTSNPIMHAIEGNRYVKGVGLNYKSSKLLADNVSIKLTSKQIEDIMYNTSEFSKLI